MEQKRGAEQLGLKGCGEIDEIHKVLIETDGKIIKNLKFYIDGQDTHYSYSSGFVSKITCRW